MTRDQQLGAALVGAAALWWWLARPGGVPSVTTDVVIDAGDDSPIGRMAKAIAIAEGFYDGDTVPRRANNPGALATSSLTDRAVPAAGGHRIKWFPTVADGWAALRAQLQRIVDGRSAHYTLSMTLEQMGLTWSNGDRNWATNVAGVLNVSTAATLGTVLT